MPTVSRLLLFSPFLLAFWLTGRAEVAPSEDEIRLRRPIALVLTDEDRRLLIANRDSGTVAVLDTQQRKVIAETRLSGQLSDMSAVPGRDLLLLTDEKAGELVIAALQRDALREVRRLKVGMSPVCVRSCDEGRVAAVACLWPRRLVLVDLEKADVSATVDLPFAPRRLLAVPGTSSLLVGDAFGGGLAVVDVRRRQIDTVRTLPAHNIRGLALDRQSKHLLLSHQVLNAFGRSTAGDITTGNLMTNHLRQLPLDAVLNPLADVLREARLYSLGDVERGAGDPMDLVDAGDGRILITLAGVDELAIGRPEKVLWTRLPVGRRPTALALDRAGKRAYVANTLSDSLSIVDLETSKVSVEVRLGADVALRPEERGESLFYDARLSHDAWFSCHSCHPDGHSNGRLNDNFTDGSFGTPKRVLSLLGVKDTGPWAWSGQMADLEAQVRTSIKSTMQGRTPTEEQVRDLTAFLRPLAPPPSLLQARGTVDAEALQRGRRVFSREKCAACHTPPTYTSAKNYDVGLRDEAGGALFNPPSLRGVSQAGPYFHDGRAASLEEVFQRQRHQIAAPLSEQELRDLLTYLSNL